MTTTEYRAVFGYPDGSTRPGEVKDTLLDAAQDHDPRSDETHGITVGVQQRKVEPWTHVSLSTIILVNEETTR